eukprot:11226942-Alexandrium_andersonii.AAC.1
MSASLVGSEMCIRDSTPSRRRGGAAQGALGEHCGNRPRPPLAHPPPPPCAWRPEALLGAVESLSGHSIVVVVGWH